MTTRQAAEFQDPFRADDALIGDLRLSACMRWKAAKLLARQSQEFA